MDGGYILLLLLFDSKLLDHLIDPMERGDRGSEIEFFILYFIANRIIEIDEMMTYVVQCWAYDVATGTVPIRTYCTCTYLLHKIGGRRISSGSSLAHDAYGTSNYQRKLE